MLGNSFKENLPGAGDAAGRRVPRQRAGGAEGTSEQKAEAERGPSKALTRSMLGSLRAATGRKPGPSATTHLRSQNSLCTPGLQLRRGRHQRLRPRVGRPACPPPPRPEATAKARGTKAGRARPPCTAQTPPPTAVRPPAAPRSPAPPFRPPHRGESGARLAPRGPGTQYGPAGEERGKAPLSAGGEGLATDRHGHGRQPGRRPGEVNLPARPSRAWPCRGPRREGRGKARGAEARSLPPKLGEPRLGTPWREAALRRRAPTLAVPLSPLRSSPPSPLSPHRELLGRICTAGLLAVRLWPPSMGPNPRAYQRYPRQGTEVQLATGIPE